MTGLNADRRRTLWVATIALAVGLPWAARAGDLAIEIVGVGSATCHVMVSVCDAERFRKKCAVGQRIPATRGTVTAVFANLTPGRYAAKAFHDENGNAKLDSNPFGVPTEAVGFSNYAAATFGPPSFADAAFDMGAGDLKIRFRLN